MVGIVFAVYSGWAEFNDYVSSVIEVIAMPIAAFSETIYYKIYSLLLSVIIFCKIFYFTDSGIKKELFLLYILNIFPLYIIFLDVNENNLLLAYILFFISILIYIISIYKIKKFYELLNKIKLYKAFLLTILPAISIFIFCVTHNYMVFSYINFSNKIADDIFTAFYICFMIGFFIIYLPLSMCLSIPLNLISEYRYFKKELKTKIQTDK